MADEKDELWDVYTKDREKTGRTHRRGDKMPPGDYHLAVHVCIFNSKNEMLLQQRQPFKSGWPNMWDISVGGSAVAGDTSSKAAERETWEELGLRLDLSDVRPHFTINFSEGFDDYYIVRKDIDISTLKLQPEEVKQVRFVGREEALKMQEEGTMIPYWFLERLYDIGMSSRLSRLSQNSGQKSEIKVDYATPKNLASWMSLIEIVKESFPGLEDEEKVAGYKKIVERSIENKRAICALYGNMVVGVILFSTKDSTLCHIVVHPEFREKGIGTEMVRMMFELVDRSKEIIVATCWEEDKF